MRISSGNPVLNGPFAALSPVAQQVAPTPLTAGYVEQPPMAPAPPPPPPQAAPQSVLGGLFGAAAPAPAQAPGGLLGMGGTLGGLLDFSDPQKLIAMQFIANGQRAPGEMFDGIPQIAAYGARMAETKQEKEQERAARNQTVEFLKANDPALAALVASGALTPAQAYSQWAQKNDPANQLDLEYKRAQLEKLRNPESDETFFGNPIFIRDANGNVVPGQMGNKGTFRPIELGEGNQLAPPTKTVNTKTEQIVMDNFGNIISRIPIENREEAFEGAVGKAQGEAAGEAITGLSGAEQKAAQALNTLDLLEKHPGLPSAVGWQGNVPEWMIPAGTDAAGFLSVLNQVQGQAFLEAFESLKGAGQITEVEGQKATQAITRLNRKLSEEEFKQAIGELRQIINNGLARSRNKAARASGEAPAAEPSVDDLLRKYGG